MSELVSKLHIISDDKTMFDTGERYTIPLYQRAYAWEDTQLVQLIEDIHSVADNEEYCLGSLIVAKQGDDYEVIDGQQRLTSLYLLLHCLGYSTNHTLTFACRKRSNYTLEHIAHTLPPSDSSLDMESIDPNIQQATAICVQTLQNNNIDKGQFKEQFKQFIDKLSRVVMYRIEVPPHTDVNRYFEIMNTRGEQLEQHDIVKAMLMSYLRNDRDRAAFARIWDACSDMTGYVQMHLPDSERKSVFGNDWNTMPPHCWDKYISRDADTAHRVGYTINQIISSDSRFDSAERLDETTNAQFTSIINFPHFLMHTLHVYLAINGITNEDAQQRIVDRSLDDKNLIKSFKRVCDSDAIKEHTEAFAQNFAICLLRTRFLFDKYILKRESNDQWSLKELRIDKPPSKHTANYCNTRFVRKGEWYQNDRSAERHKRILMLQSALRVSYTSAQSMHWITELLIWLSQAECSPDNQDVDMTKFDTVIEDIAKQAVQEQFFEVRKRDTYNMGTRTPHIVFNYLDFLLWEKDPDKYADFTFTFRNSVEHWYPQHPSEDTFDPWDEVNRFGNLCIIPRDVNAKFSNMSPEAKNSTFRHMIAQGSLKLRLMSQFIEHAGTNASQKWKDPNGCAAHEKEMIDLLRQHCCPDK